jgi:hypothetical protein
LYLLGRDLKPAALRIGDDLLDWVEVEVHADPLEEVVVEGDEADFDRDLQVLHPPQLLQQIDDLLVDFLRLADDEAEVRGRGGDRCLCRRCGPTSWARRSA